jgi:TatD DNase family protein
VSQQLSWPQQVSWIDTHSHLTDESLLPKLAEILRRAEASHVDRIVCVAVDAKTARESMDLVAEAARECKPRLFFSAGIHPNYAHQEATGDWDTIRNLLVDQRIVALGETGLDQYWDDCPREVQLRNFQRHFRASRETGLPVIIHSRDCEQIMLQTLREERRHGELHGVMHSFAGSEDMAKECIDLGLYISFSGIVTYKKNTLLREVAAKAPIDRILLETDAPYLSPDPVRSTRPNEPALMVHTASVVASARGMQLEELAAATTANARRLLCRMQ